MRKTLAEAEGIEGTSTETTLNVAVEAAGGTGEEHSELSTVNEESGHIVGEEHHARCAHPDEEEGYHVTCQQRHERGKNDGEEAGETEAAKATEEISKEDVEIRRHIEERRSTPKEEKQRLKEVSKCKKMYQRQKRMKRQQDIQRILDEFKGVKNIPGIKSAEKKVLITKIKNEKGEIITSRKGIANVFGEFYKKIYDDHEHEETEPGLEKNKNESSIVVQNKDTSDMTGYSRDHD